MDRSGMPEQCRLHMSAKTSTKEPKGAMLSNITCLNAADQGHFRDRVLLLLKERDRIKIEKISSQNQFFLL